MYYMRNLIHHLTHHHQRRHPRFHHPHHLFLDLLIKGECYLKTLLGLSFLFYLQFS